MSSNSNPDWDKILLACRVLEDFADIRKALEDTEHKQALNGYNPRSKSGTSRTHIRVTDEQKEWGSDIADQNGFRSRGLLYGSCVGFAMANPGAFAAYVQKVTSSTMIQESENLSSNSTTNEPDSNSEAPMDRESENGSPNSSDDVSDDEWEEVKEEMSGGSE